MPASLGAPQVEEILARKNAASFLNNSYEHPESGGFARWDWPGQPTFRKEPMHGWGCVKHGPKLGIRPHGQDAIEPTWEQDHQDELEDHKHKFQGLCPPSNRRVFSKSASALGGRNVCTFSESQSARIAPTTVA